MKSIITIVSQNNKFTSKSFTISDTNVSEENISMHDTLEKCIKNSKSKIIFYLNSDTNSIVNMPLDTGYKNIDLDEKNTLSVIKQTYTELEKKFENTKNIYVFSPFHILLEESKKKNTLCSLNFLIYNNKIYVLTADKNAKIIYHSILSLTSKKQIRKDAFLKTDSIGDKSLEDIIKNEIKTFIEDCLLSFYKQSNSFFIENITIHDSIGLLNDDQIKKISSDLIIDISLFQIPINDVLLNIKDKNINLNSLSYTAVRENKKSNKRRTVLLSILLFVLLFFSLVQFSSNGTIDFEKMFTMNDSNKTIQTDISKDKNNDQGTFHGIKFYLTDSFTYVKDFFSNDTNESNKNNDLKLKVAKKNQTKIKKNDAIKLPKKISLIDHIEYNNKIKKDILDHFGAIGYDAVIENINISKNSSSSKINFLSIDSFIKNTKPNMEKIYRKVRLRSQKEINGLFLGKIQASKKFENIHSIKHKTKIYNYNKTYSYANIQLSALKVMPDDTKLKFKKENKSSFRTYKYSVETKIKSLDDFFSIIDNLNRQKKSLVINYPILFIKHPNYVRVNFSLEFYQNL